MNDSKCADALKKARSLVEDAANLQRQGKWFAGEFFKNPRIEGGKITGTATIEIGSMDRDLAEKLLNEIEDKINECYLESARRRMDTAADLSRDILIHTSQRAGGMPNEE